VNCPVAHPKVFSRFPRYYSCDGSRLELLFTVWPLASATLMAQTVTPSLSSASATPGSAVSLNLSMSSSGDQPAALQWTLNVPSTVQSVTAAVGSAASSAGKSISCANNICIISAMNTTPIANGVVAVLSLTLPSTASGTLPIQISGGVAADPTGASIPVTASGGKITVTIPITMSLTPTSVTLSASQTQQFTATVSGSSNTTVQWSMSGTVGTLSSTGLYIRRHPAFRSRRLFLVRPRAWRAQPYPQPLRSR